MPSLPHQDHSPTEDYASTHGHEGDSACVFKVRLNVIVMSPHVEVAFTNKILVLS
jgi:hypothetical protein